MNAVVDEVQDQVIKKYHSKLSRVVDIISSMLYFSSIFFFTPLLEVYFDVWVSFRPNYKLIPSVYAHLASAAWCYKRSRQNLDWHHAISVRGGQLHRGREPVVGPIPDIHGSGPTRQSVSSWKA